ncbi:hypothetical protein ACS0TY_036855 [Phlomoides rotata]
MLHFERGFREEVFGIRWKIFCFLQRAVSHDSFWVPALVEIQVPAISCSFVFDREKQESIQTNGFLDFGARFPVIWGCQPAMQPF